MWWGGAGSREEGKKEGREGRQMGRRKEEINEWMDG